MDGRRWVRIPPLQQNISWGRAEVARKAHNLEVGGSIPSPATKMDFKKGPSVSERAAR